MITDNDKRCDRFFEMSPEEFNCCVQFALRNSDRKIVFSQYIDGVTMGGMADTMEDALYWCNLFYSKNNKIGLCIGDFSKQALIWTHNDILHKLGLLSDAEYDLYLDSVDFED